MKKIILMAVLFFIGGFLVSDGLANFDLIKKGVHKAALIGCEVTAGTVNRELTETRAAAQECLEALQSCNDGLKDVREALNEILER